MGARRAALFVAADMVVGCIGLAWLTGFIARAYREDSAARR